MDSEAASRTKPVVLLGLFVLVAGALLVGPLSRGSGGSGPCSDLPPGTIEESDVFTPAGQQRGRMPERPILANGPGLDPLPRGDGVPPEIDGRPLRHAVESAQGPYLWYLDRLIEPDMTRSDFLAAGGLEYSALTIDDGVPFGPALIAEVGDRATPVRVGAFDGALVWADPTEDNVRAHGLYWADATRNYSLVAVRGPESLVNIGRGLVCGPIR